MRHARSAPCHRRHLRDSSQRHVELRELSASQNEQNRGDTNQEESKLQPLSDAASGMLRRRERYRWIRADLENNAEGLECISLTFRQGLESPYIQAFRILRGLLLGRLNLKLIN